MLRSASDGSYTGALILDLLPFIQLLFHPPEGLVNSVVRLRKAVETKYLEQSLAEQLVFCRRPDCDHGPARIEDD